MSYTDLSLPYWARRLYRAAPRRAVVRVEAERALKGRVPACVHLECGHTLIVKLPARVEVPGRAEDDLPISMNVDTLPESRCRSMLPAQRCEECQRVAYPELTCLTLSGGRVAESHFAYTEQVAVRIEVHERGERVAPVPRR